MKQLLIIAAIVFIALWLFLPLIKFILFYSLVFGVIYFLYKMYITPTNPKP